MPQCESCRNSVHRCCSGGDCDCPGHDREAPKTPLVQAYELVIADLSKLRPWTPPDRAIFSALNFRLGELRKSAQEEAEEHPHAQT